MSTLPQQRKTQRDLVAAETMLIELRTLIRLMDSHYDDMLAQHTILDTLTQAEVASIAKQMGSGMRFSFVLAGFLRERMRTAPTLSLRKPDSGVPIHER